MSSTVTVGPDALLQKDTSEKRVVQFDWDALGLAAGVTISASTYTVTRVLPLSASDDTATLTTDNASILTGSRKTQVRILAGTLGGRYQLTNHVTTNESPAQEKEGSIYVEIVDK